MKIYFTASIKGKSLYFDNYKKIIKSLENIGVEVECQDVMQTTSKRISSLADERRIEHYRNVLKWINVADIVIAETSYPSLGVGFEISLALEKGKTVIVLYTVDYPAHLLKGIISDSLIIVRYELENLTKTLADALKYAKDQLDTRFTLLFLGENF